MLTTTLPSDGIPLYHHLKEIFAERIAAGEWKVGDLIPTEAQLCAAYGVSRGPVRQAIDLLVQQGVLARKQGKGTWVRPHKLESGLATFYSFTTLIAEQGYTPSTRLLHFGREEAIPSVRRALALESGAPVYRMARLRLANGEPIILETVFLPVARAPGLEQPQIEAHSLYALLQDRYGLPLTRARQSFEAVIADEYEANRLAVAPGAPLLLLENLTYAAGDLPIVFSKAVLRGDRLRYYADLSTRPTPAPADSLPALS
jgi:GntR family transcriptional regulator